MLSDTSSDSDYLETVDPREESYCYARGDTTQRINVFTVKTCCLSKTVMFLISFECERLANARLPKKIHNPVKLVRRLMDRR